MELDAELGALQVVAAGSVVVAGAGACPVNLARNDLALLEQESCGLCVACREGTMQMAEILTDITAGQAHAGDVDLLHELAQNLALRGPCGWGRAAAQPVLSTLAHFRAECEAHVKDNRCAAGVCPVGVVPAETVT